MTDDELNEIEARANAVTPGKNFIAHAREDIPALLAEVRQLRAERDVLAAIDSVCPADIYECMKPLP